MPTQATVGPWDPKLQHGGPPAALLGSALEATQPRESTRIAHFALEFLGPLGLGEMQVTTEVVRPGKKVEMLSAVASQGGRPALRVQAWRVHVEDSRNPDVRIDEPPPPLPPAAETRIFEGVAPFGYALALEWRFAEGGFHQLGPAAVWTRLRASIIEGEPPSQLARVLAMVDSANGISAELDVRKYLFVPVNLTVSLARLPEAEWVGMRAVTSIAREGVGTTHARLFDPRGFCGYALQTLYVGPR